MCLDRFLLLKVSRFSFLLEFTCIQFCRLRQRVFIIIIIFIKITKMLPVCFIHTLITQLWIYQWSLETSPKTHKLFFYGCMLLRTNTNQGWQRLFISVDRLFMTIFKSFAFDSFPRFPLIKLKPSKCLT